MGEFFVTVFWYLVAFAAVIFGTGALLWSIDSPYGIFIAVAFWAWVLHLFVWGMIEKNIEGREKRIAVQILIAVVAVCVVSWYGLRPLFLTSPNVECLSNYCPPEETVEFACDTPLSHIKAYKESHPGVSVGRLMCD